MTERMNVKILGLELGTASGWDQVGDESIFFYDFEPHKDYVSLLPLKGGFTFDYLEGTMTSDSDNATDELFILNVFDVLTGIHKDKWLKGINNDH